MSNTIDMSVTCRGIRREARDFLATSYDDVAKVHGIQRAQIVTDPFSAFRSTFQVPQRSFPSLPRNAEEDV